MPKENRNILSDDAFFELTEAAYSNPATAKDRIVGAATGTIVFAGCTGVLVAGTWGWAKALDWLEERRSNRRCKEFESKYHATKSD